MRNAYHIGGLRYEFVISINVGLNNSAYLRHTVTRTSCMSSHFDLTNFRNYYPYWKFKLPPIFNTKQCQIIYMPCANSYSIEQRIRQQSHCNRSSITIKNDLKRIPMFDKRYWLTFVYSNFRKTYYCLVEIIKLLLTSPISQCMPSAYRYIKDTIRKSCIHVDVFGTLRVDGEVLERPSACAVRKRVVEPARRHVFTGRLSWTRLRRGACNGNKIRRNDIVVQ